MYSDPFFSEAHAGIFCCAKGSRDSDALLWEAMAANAFALLRLGDQLKRSTIQPDNYITDGPGATGVITSTVILQRQIQLAMKLQF